ncbi:MAG TPA: phosphate ABC transporter substrate-binding/OmpA family protein [Blastocatellia bacterium]|nr:phosphate ABC transporter substrate-binding/OmpA family protein [Blastocatellia bacterium]
MRIGRVELRPGAIILILLVMVGLVYAGLRQLGMLDTLLAKFDPRTGEKKSVVLPGRENLGDYSDTKLPPSTVKAPERTSDNPDVTIGLWTWQTESGIIDAVGGPKKSGDYANSCLCQAGITNTKLVIQNDTSEQIKALAAGQMQLVTTTGDQAAVDIAGANKLLRGNKAKVIWSGGYSYGEDCLIGPESWKRDPQLARGALVVTAVPYCDWNVTVNWAVDNQIPVNPDEQVYDPDAINFVNATDHIEAAQKYVNNAKVSLRNRATGKNEDHEINAVATWTPGDVMAVKGRSSVNYKSKSEKVQKIVSTRQYSYMMPHILFGNEDWLDKHRDYVKTLLRCLARSNEKIQQDESYFRDRVAVLNALVFNMEGMGPNFWSTYFKGNTEDGVPLGGSRVNNIAEVRHLFGLDGNQPLARSIFGISYTDHGKRLQKLLPDRLPTITPVDQVVDLSFIRDITDEKTTEGVYTASFSSGGNQGTVVKANYQITFDSGSAKVKPTEVNTLQDIRSLLVRASDTKVIVEGHTDNVGDDATNLRLSKERAKSVWQWLKDSDPSGVNINDKRLEAIEGYGSYRPLPGNQNSNDAEKAANRRVVIILK